MPFLVTWSKFQKDFTVRWILVFFKNFRKNLKITIHRPPNNLVLSSSVLSFESEDQISEQNIVFTIETEPEAYSDFFEVSNLSRGLVQDCKPYCRPNQMKEAYTVSVVFSKSENFLLLISELLFFSKFWTQKSPYWKPSYMLSNQCMTKMRLKFVWRLKHLFQGEISARVVASVSQSGTRFSYSEFSFTSLLIYES